MSDTPLDQVAKRLYRLRAAIERRAARTALLAQLDLLDRACVKAIEEDSQLAQDFNVVGENLDAAEGKIEELKIESDELEELRKLFIAGRRAPRATHKQTLAWLRRKLALKPRG